MALANFCARAVGTVQHFGAHDKKVEDLAGDFRGVEDGVDALVGEDLGDERLPGDDGLVGCIVHERGNDVGVGGVDQTVAWRVGPADC